MGFFDSNSRGLNMDLQMLAATAPAVRSTSYRYFPIHLAHFLWKLDQLCLARDVGQLILALPSFYAAPKRTSATKNFSEIQCPKF
jgi:hypothetical protein